MWWKIYCCHKKIFRQIILLVISLASKNVAFTKFLSKMHESEFPKLSHCAFLHYTEHCCYLIWRNFSVPWHYVWLFHHIIQTVVSILELISVNSLLDSGRFFHDWDHKCLFEVLIVQILWIWKNSILILAQTGHRKLSLSILLQEWKILWYYIDIIRKGVLPAVR